MSTKPDSGTGENPAVDAPPPEADAPTVDEPAAEAVDADEQASDGGVSEAEGLADATEVEIAVEAAGGTEAEVADEDADIAIEVEVPEPEPDPMAELQAKIEQLEADRTELTKKNKDTYERLLRATADLDNFRKRSRRDVDNAKVEARSKTLIEMLPVVDNLERAVAHADTSSDAKGIADGVNLVLRQFGQALERCGVAPVDAIGKPFDPNLHEAVSQQESSEHPPGTIVAELQRGYTIGERLLRPTLAVVSTAPAEAAEEPPKANGHDTSADAVSADAEEPSAQTEAAVEPATEPEAESDDGDGEGDADASEAAGEDSED